MRPVLASMRQGLSLNLDKFWKQYVWRGRWVGMGMSGSLERKMNSPEV